MVRFIADSAFENDFTSVHSSFRTYIYQQVRSPHYFFIVLHHDHCIANIPEFFEHINQPFCVSRMQSYAWLIEDIEGTNERTSQGRNEIDSLALASRQGVRVPVQGKIR